MEHTEQESLVAEHSSSPQNDEAPTPEATAVTVARMLANPRRIRRS
jgi:hypothetical protein